MDQEAVGPLGAARVSELVDDSHSHTNVFCGETLTAGNAHHEYGIRDKDGKFLCHLKFQDGPIGEVGVNGVMNENLIAVLIDRLRGFQSGDFKCRENNMALIKLEEALMWLNERTRGREKRGVEGKNKV